MNAKEHILVCLGEEGAEVAQDVSKCLRFGINDVNFLNLSGPNNWQRLVNELNDLLAVADLAAEHGIIPVNWRSARKQRDKKAKVKKCMEYAREQGALK